ncbi:MAG: hypothetical protein JNM99_06275 [Verrucomicrobiaceae bacterium]|nr:hypothetical protein [Verrucomicrobiaceae bacterium]
MNSSQHFLLSFATSIFVALAGSVGVILAQDWLIERDLPPYILALVAFIILHFTVRWYFSNFVRVKCPYGCGQKALPIRGRSDRFRCESCGQDF